MASVIRKISEAKFHMDPSGSTDSTSYANLGRVSEKRRQKSWEKKNVSGVWN
jgi:hypothetical protein